MTFSIEYPPATKACARCQSPLVWLYSARTSKWFSVVPEPAETDVIRVHRCPQYPDDRPAPAWREIHEIDEDTKRVGIARVRQALASKENET